MSAIKQSITGTGNIVLGANTLTVAGTSSVSGTNTGDQTSVTGNAGTATALATARNIFNISFDGTANVAGDATNTGHFASIPGTGAAGHFVTQNGTAPTLIAGRSAWYSDGSGVPSFKNGTGAAVTLVRSSDLGTGIATFLGTPSSANLAAAVTDETGSGALTFATSPTFTTSIIAGSSTMALFNTTATTVNAFGAATNIVLGGANSIGLTTTSQISVPLNSLTTGTGLYLASSSLTNGKMLDIQVTGTTSATSPIALNVSLAGANSGSSTTSTAATFSNTRTNLTSNTNVALTLTASGGTTNNALNITAGNSLFPDGSASAPSIQFGSDTNTGIYRIGSDNIGIATNGTLRWHVSSGGNLFSGSGNYDYNIGASLFLGSSGSAAAPTFSFGSSTDTNTGMYRVSEDQIGFTAGGTLRATINTTDLVLTVGLTLPKTITAGGTTGAQTINKTSGSVNFAAGAASLVVTNSLVTTSSVILLTGATNDVDQSVFIAVAAAGSFTIYPATVAASYSHPYAETRVNFLVLN